MFATIACFYHVILDEPPCGAATAPWTGRSETIRRQWDAVRLILPEYDRVGGEPDTLVLHGHCIDFTLSSRRRSNATEKGLLKKP